MAFSADKGHLSSQFTTGNLYFTGRGTKVDYVKGFKYFKMVADRDKTNFESQYYVGLCYFQPLGIEKNYKEALRYFKIIADKGVVANTTENKDFVTACILAQNAIGRIYETELDKDLDKSLQYYKLAMENRSEEGTKNYKRIRQILFDVK